jgi:osmotically-inducible protein OsmY
MQKSKGFISAVMIVMTLAAVACASTRTQKSAGEQVDDSVTTGRVKAALIADPVTKAHQIDVETFKGTVQLNGFVDTSASKERATTIAKNTRGVTSVHNNLTVKAAGDRTGEQVVDDGAITTKVKAAALKRNRRPNSWRAQSITSSPWTTSSTSSDRCNQRR